MTTDGNDHDAEQRYEGAAATLEFALWSLDEQIQAIRDIDAKAERALTLAVAILALFSGAITFQWGEATDHVSLLAAAGTVIVIFVIAVALFFHCQAAANLHLGPDSKSLLALSAEQRDGMVRQWLAEHVHRSVENNQGLILAKNSRYLRLAYAVTAEAAFASIAVLAIASA